MIFHDRCLEIFGNIKYKQFRFNLLADNTRYYLQLAWDDRCAVTGGFYINKSRKWFLSPHMTTSELVQTAFKAVLTAEEHEVREHFKYREQPIFAPHWDVEFLAHMLKTAPPLDKRDEHG